MKNRKKQFSKARASYFLEYRKTDKNKDYQKKQYEKRRKMTKREKIDFAIQQLEIIRAHIDLTEKPEIQEIFYNLVTKLNDK